MTICDAEPEQRGGLNTRHVIRACDVIGFTLRYQTADQLAFVRAALGVE